MAILQNTDLRILVVDDQDSVRSHLSQELLRMGVKQVLEAASAEEALAVFEQHQPDLVLLDILMPGKNGYWIAERIRDLEDGRWTPIIFLTGMGRDEDLWEGIRAGGDDYLVKPVRATVLAAKIRAMQRLLTMQRRLVTVTEELYEANRELNSLIERDALTGLVNRRGFDRVLHAAWLLDQGDAAEPRQVRAQVAAIKVVAARLQQRVVDRAMQIFGAMGLSPDTPLAAFWTWGRALRLMDGPDEVHLRTVARQVLAQARAGLGSHTAYFTTPEQLAAPPHLQA